MAEQHHELRSGHETPQDRARSGTEIGPPFPRARLGVHQDSALPVARGTLHEGDSRVAAARAAEISAPTARSSAATTLVKFSGYKSASHPAATAPTVATGTGCAARAPAMISASVTTRPPKLSVSRR